MVESGGCRRFAGSCLPRWYRLVAESGEQGQFQTAQAFLHRASILSHRGLQHQPVNGAHSGSPTSHTCILIPDSFASFTSFPARQWTQSIHFRTGFHQLRILVFPTIPASLVPVASIQPQGDQPSWRGSTPTSTRTCPGATGTMILSTSVSAAHALPPCPPTKPGLRCPALEAPCPLSSALSTACPGSRVVLTGVCIQAGESWRTTKSYERSVRRDDESRRRSACDIDLFCL